MPRISPIVLDQADETTIKTLNAVKDKIGMIPNLFSTFALAPAALNGYLAFSDALEKGRLSPRQREVIILAVSQINTCQYCLSAHTLMGKNTGMSEADTIDARNGKANDVFENAIASFAVKVALQRGMISDEEMDLAKDANIDDALKIEITANVVFSILTNFTNNLAKTDIDFPIVTVEL